MHRTSRTIAFVATIVAAASGAAKASVPLGYAERNDAGPTLVEVLQQVTPAVTYVEVKAGISVGQSGPSKERQKARLPAKESTVAARRDEYAAGSGVVIDASAGLIVTNKHVIDLAGKITVRLVDGRKFDAVKVGSDPDTDVAVIRVEASGLTAIQFGDSEALKVGESVLAIGNPLRLGQTVTSGIVSGLHRSNMGIARYEDFIQTDAAIYPGNSGGALVNLRGQLVGINTAFVAPGKANPGLGFAIPVRMVRAVVDQIREFGEVRRAKPQVTFEDPAATQRQHLNFPIRLKGAVIVKVNAPSVEDASLKSGDVITAINGIQVQDASHLRTTIALLRPGEVAEVAMMREGHQIVVHAVVAKLGPHARSR